MSPSVRSLDDRVTSSLAERIYGQERKERNPKDLLIYLISDLGKTDLLVNFTPPRLQFTTFAQFSSYFCSIVYHVCIVWLLLLHFRLNILPNHAYFSLNKSTLSLYNQRLAVSFPGLTFIYASILLEKQKYLFPSPSSSIRSLDTPVFTIPQQPMYVVCRMHLNTTT